MITHEDIKVDDTYISLSKLTGKKIKDIQGYLDIEFDDPVFHATSVIMEDGSEMGAEGEHDLPYLISYRTQPQPNMDDKTLRRLWKEANPEEADELEDEEEE